MHFTKNAELELWFASNTQLFLDSRFVSFDRGIDGKIHLTLIEYVSGGRAMAGDPITEREYMLTIEETDGLGTVDTDFATSDLPKWCVGVEMDSTDTGLAFHFQLDNDETLSVRCERLKIVMSREETKLVAPQLELGLSARVPGLPLPSPEEWLERFRAENLEVLWRTWDGDGSSMPEAGNYVGWYLQSKELLATTKTGLFFYHCAIDQDTLAIRWTLEDSDNRRLWEVAKRLLVNLKASVLCGNCQFLPDEWAAYVQAGVWPERFEKSRNCPTKP
jgi:hypothetical protein